jgi:DMSO/TMAO reductase YedYZ heme-binding membrane subunit
LWTAFSAATVLTVGVSAVFLAVAGADEANTRFLARLTARLALIVLLLVFVARPLNQLLGKSWSRALVRHRSLLGVTFAGVHTGHLLVLICHARLATGFDLSITANVLGALTYALIYAMLLTTFSGPKRYIGPRAWRLLHRSGLYWISAVFVSTLLPESLDELDKANAFLLAAFAAAATVRVGAFTARRARLDDGGDGVGQVIDVAGRYACDVDAARVDHVNAEVSFQPAHLFRGNAEKTEHAVGAHQV